MREIRSFGRIRGRSLSQAQQELMNNSLNKWLLGEVEFGFNPSKIDQTKNGVWFEIGFGGAEHLIAQAMANPNIQFIGAEPFKDGISKALRAIEDNEIKNIKIIDNDARPILNNLCNECLDRIFILFPDPWPKLRHHKRRLIDDAFVENLVRILKKGGKIRFASDWANYAEEALACFIRNPNLEWTANSQKDWQIPPDDHFTTRYQEKKLGDCAPQFFDFIRL